MIVKRIAPLAASTAALRLGELAPPIADTQVSGRGVSTDVFRIPTVIICAHSYYKSYQVYYTWYLVLGWRSKKQKGYRGVGCSTQLVYWLLEAYRKNKEAQNDTSSARAPLLQWRPETVVKFVGAKRSVLLRPFWLFCVIPQPRLLILNVCSSA